MAVAVETPAAAEDLKMMDGRTPSTAPREASVDAERRGGGVEEGAYEPDLSKEVSMMSTKLINAINYQTTLDDALQAARHELEQAQREVKRVQAEKKSLDDAIADGILVKKSEVDKTIAAIRADLAEEKERRASAERARRQTDGELESLTSSLFEEANKMVAEARRETETAERRTSQLRRQLNDTEVLIASQQEQLQDMKLALTSNNDNAQQAQAAPNGTAEAEATDLPIRPEHPLFFSHLLSPVLRTDVSAYVDFSELLSFAHRAAPANSLQPGGTIGASASSTNLNILPNTSTAPSSSPNLPGAFSFSSSSASNSPSSSNFPPVVPTLKESKFYKRCVLEDIEPTLRLDLAPGLSFLSRRSVQSALQNGTLIVEPFAQTANWKFYSPVFPCALCGESRKADIYTRRHRFRTSESDDAQRYPLCDYCLGRVRATGDFVGFLRLVRDGHWRCGNEEEDKAAWEESVRLRERMFWARIAGGVVPATAAGAAKETLESVPERPVHNPDDVFQIPSGSEEANQVEMNAAAPVPSTPQPDDKTTTDDEAAVETTEPMEAQALKELRRRTMLRRASLVDGEKSHIETESRSQDEAPFDHNQHPDERDEHPQQDAGSGYTTPNEEAESRSMQTSTSAPTATEDAAATPKSNVEWQSTLMARPGSASGTTTGAGRSSPSLASEQAPNERRPLSVLGRIRAMEGRK